MPVQYIIGEWDFCDIRLKLRPPVFIPRPETELLVEIASSCCRKGNEKILEIGCGSGAISLALLKMFPQISSTAVDKSSEACDLTLENAQLLELEGRITVFNEELNLEEGRIKNIQDEQFDLIVSNPPYVLFKDMFQLQPEISLYEDHDALNGGHDGLKIIRAIFTFSSTNLKKDGYIVLEVDPTHPHKIKEYLESNHTLNLQHVETICDFTGKERYVKIKKMSVV